MSQSAITIRLDNQTKVQFDNLCDQFGKSSSTAINIFIKAVVRTRQIPFTISAEIDSSTSNLENLLLDQLKRNQQNPNSEMTLEEINAEIDATRQERKNRH